MELRDMTKDEQDKLLALADALEGVHIEKTYGPYDGPDVAEQRAIDTAADLIRALAEQDAPQPEAQAQPVAWQNASDPGDFWSKKPAHIETRPLFSEPQLFVAPDGFALVPVEPTQEMWAAFRNNDCSSVEFQRGYRAMITAAPAQPQPEAQAPQKPTAWFTEDHLTDKSATTYSSEVADRWRAKGWPVSELFAAPAQPQPKNPWREAVINELVVAHIYQKAHEDDPRKAIQDAITWHCQVALDPAVSSDAQALIERGRAQPQPPHLVEDLAQLVVRLCRKLRKTDPLGDHKSLTDGAMDFLRRKGLQGSPLRGESSGITQQGAEE